MTLKRQVTDAATLLQLVVLAADERHNGEFIIIGSDEGYRCVFGLPKMTPEQREDLLIAVPVFATPFEALTNALVTDQSILSRSQDEI